MRVLPLYHSIGGSLGGNSVSTDEFELQTLHVQQSFRSLPMRDLASAMTDPKNVACLTFDDGYLDNYSTALPLLERHGLKATFFVATEFVGGQFNGCPMMSHQHLRELTELGHEIGAHSVSHAKLTRISGDAAFREVKDSKSILEDLLGQPVVSFAYPYGNYDRHIRDQVEAAGFQTAVTVEEGLVSSGSDWLTLPRVWIDGRGSFADFEASLSWATDWYWRIRGWTG